MVIKPSPTREIAQLIAALSSDDDVRRDAATARLAVLGTAGLDRLLAAYAAGDGDRSRIAMLRVFESIGDERAVGVARAALPGGGDLAVAAAATLGSLLNSPSPKTATSALDALVAGALDAGAERQVRLAAYDALRQMPKEILGPLTQSIAADPDRSMAALIDERASDVAITAAVWRDALDGRLPASPGTLRRSVIEGGTTAPLGTLKAMIDAVRAREAAARSAASAAEWQAARGALHQALALRGSRIALYDLRESLADAVTPLAPSFLAALHAIGDLACLEPLAVAHTRAPARDERWRRQLVEAFHAISRRERITRRHAVMKRIVARWPDAARAFDLPVQ